MPDAYERPDTLDDALAVLADGKWTVLAGGTDIFPAAATAYAWGRPRPERILDISAIDALRGIEETEYAFRIGSRVTWTEMIESALPGYFACLRQSGREVGGIQIQNRGTIVGNICNASPAADGVPALMALDAEVELAGPAGPRRVPLAAFIRGNRRTDLHDGELVTGLVIPKRLDTARSNFRKLGARRYLVISIAMVAALLETDPSGQISHARVAVGACSEVAQRLPALEAALLGRACDDTLGDALTADMLAPLSPIDDVRGDAAYRRDAADALVRRALADLGQPI
jgi:CO/xanthine dehydrogenase FAD-binding subunit